MEYIDQIIKDCKDAKKTKHKKSYILKNPDAQDLDKIKHIKQAIYVIEDKSSNINQTFVAMKTFKEKRTHACPKINASPCKTMYVGSSNKSLKTRLAQHLGLRGKSTYALHLQQWFHDDFEIKIYEYDTSPAILQILEDALAHEHKPAFGKTGSNNK